MPPAPKLTEEGILRSQLDPRLHNALRAFHRSARAQREQMNPFLESTCPEVYPVLMQQLTPGLERMLLSALQPEAERWVNRKIIPHCVYGIRTYQRGAILKAHRDREGTHIVSAIINVDQQVEEPWALHVESETPGGDWRRCYLQPGEMLLYESERLLHGRLDPLVGHSFSNVFVHYKLA